MTCDVRLGNCLDVLEAMDENTLDALVTDPPYGLGFMGQEWDKALPDPKIWRECLRVMKPGAHGVIFGAPRLYHRLACQVEDAGFEVRDVLMWMFGSGFPKNHDPSRAVDKKRNDAEEVRVVCRAIRAQMDALEVSSREIADDFGMHSRMVDHWAARDTDSQPLLPTWDQWVRLRDLLGMGGELDAEVRRLNDRKGQVAEAWLERPITGEVRPRSRVNNYGITSRDGLARDLPQSEEARRLLGLGTALKPAYEPILLVRKPLRGSVVENALAYGTGCLNIGTCRVEGAPRDPGFKAPTDDRDGAAGLGGLKRSVLVGRETPEGRWPANVVLDEEAGALLDEQSGTLKAGAHPKRRNATPNIAMNGANYARETEARITMNSGGASRFFYCAKASKAEREAGLEHLGTRTVTDGREVTNDTAYQRGATERRNTHPTVKPIALMRYLVRLIAPEGGTVFDPFTGSGSTGVACALEGVDFLGAELDGEYVKIAEARIAHAKKERLGSSVRGQGSIFDLMKGA